MPVELKEVMLQCAWERGMDILPCFFFLMTHKALGIQHARGRPSGHTAAPPQERSAQQGLSCGANTGPGNDTPPHGGQQQKPVKWYGRTGGWLPTAHFPWEGGLIVHPCNEQKVQDSVGLGKLGTTDCDQCNNIVFWQNILQRDGNFNNQHWITKRITGPDCSLERWLIKMHALSRLDSEKFWEYSTFHLKIFHWRGLESWHRG